MYSNTSSDGIMAGFPAFSFICRDSRASADEVRPGDTAHAWCRRCAGETRSEKERRKIGERQEKYNTVVLS